MSAVAAVDRRPSHAPSPAVAPPPGNPRFPLFDSLRGVAVLAVLAFHATAVSGGLTNRVMNDSAVILGHLGPIVFFVISGFLLYRPYVAARAAGRDGPRPRRYARRRALRILPAYWFALTVLAIYPGIMGPFTGDWWRYYGFLQVYSHGTVLGGLGVAWTLCVEVTFYVALPLWAFGMRRLSLGSGPRAWLWAELPSLALVALLGAMVQVAVARHVVSDLLGTSLPGECVWFAIGMALAVASVAEERGLLSERPLRIVANHPGALWLGALACFAGLVAVLHPGSRQEIAAALTGKQPVTTTVTAIALTGGLCALLVLPAVSGDRAGGLPRRFLASAPIAWIGLVSYGIYLWHHPIALVLAQPHPFALSASGLGLANRIQVATTPILFVLIVAAASTAAAISYRFVELPFLRRKEG